MKYIETQGKVIKSWCDNPEEECITQATRLAELPFTFHHVALMPDTHSGYGMPIGGVWATEGVVVPYAVGMDIGCSVSVMRTTTESSSLTQEKIKEILGEIRQVLPVGVGKYAPKNNDFQPFKLDAKLLDNYMMLPNNIKDLIDHHYHHSPSVGEGNHFVELQSNEDGLLHVMMHFGSRNLGATICKYYHNLAKDLNEKWYSKVDPKWQLSFLPMDSDEGKEYWAAMEIACHYAQYNHIAARIRITDVLKEHNIAVEWYHYINHNFAKIENHFGKNVIVHRKGATQAFKGQMGIIPGSQGTASYLVNGLGNPESFMSCSHGAGRVMSRTKAIAELDLEVEKKKLDDLGIIHSIRNQDDLEEASSAYKDIDEVMAAQKDLVEIIDKFEPLAVIKG